MLNQIESNQPRKYSGNTQFDNWSSDDVNSFALFLAKEEYECDPFYHKAATDLVCSCVHFLQDYCSGRLSDVVGLLSEEVEDAIMQTNKEAESGGGKQKNFLPDLNSLRKLVNMANKFDGTKEWEQQSEYGTIMKHVEDRHLDAGIFDMPDCVFAWQSFCLAPSKVRMAVAANLVCKISKMQLSSFKEESANGLAK